MLLSKLVFLCVKNVIYLDDSSFNYPGFCKGDFDNDNNYSTAINNVFSPLNEAISRLQDLDKIPYVVGEVQPNEERIVDLSSLEKKPRRIVGLAVTDQFGNYKKLAFTMFGKDKLRIKSSYSTFSTKFYVEYQEHIETFSSFNIVPLEEDGTDNNIDLFETYGIDEAMSNYIMEYVQGKLQEPIAPELANMHLTRAESYFNNLKDAIKNFPQQVVEKVYTMDD